MRSWKRTVARAFDGAEGYDGAASIQAEAAGRLAAEIARQPLDDAPRVLEIGCGTGLLTAALRARIATGSMVVSDIAPGMIRRCRARFSGEPDLRFLVMDGERPCLLPGFDLIGSNLAAQWFEDLPAALGRLSALLAPGGLLAVSTLAAGTFREWQAAHAALGLEAGTPTYPPLAALRALRFVGCTTSVSSASLVEAHTDGRAFLKALRAIGAGTPVLRPALSPGALRRVLHRYDASGASATYVVANVLIRRV
jgi:malonyl-CoA O-methyltransferase